MEFESGMNERVAVFRERLNFITTNNDPDDNYHLILAEYHARFLARVDKVTSTLELRNQDFFLIL